MSEGKSVQYTIGVKGEGLEHLAKLTSGLDGASAEAAHLKEEAAKVSQQLAAVGQQQQAIDKAVISINDHPAIRECFKDFQMEALKLDYTVGGGANRVERGELVIYSWNREAEPAGLF